MTHWGIRRMKTKWGSCIPESTSILLNLELAKKHPQCLEYVVVHELAHFREDNHGERFTKLMDSLMPDWRSRRDARPSGTRITTMPSSATWSPTTPPRAAPCTPAWP